MQQIPQLPTDRLDRVQHFATRLSAIQAGTALGTAIQNFTHLFPADSQARRLTIGAIRVRDDAGLQLFQAIKGLQFHLEPRRLECHRQHHPGVVGRIAGAWRSLRGNDDNSEREIAQRLSEAIADFFKQVEISDCGELDLLNSRAIYREMDTDGIPADLRGSLARFFAECGEDVSGWEGRLRPIQWAYQHATVTEEGLPQWPAETPEAAYRFFGALREVMERLQQLFQAGGEHQNLDREVVGPLLLLQKKMNELCSKLSIPSGDAVVNQMRRVAAQRALAEIEAARRPQIEAALRGEAIGHLNREGGRILEQVVQTRVGQMLYERRGEMWRSMAAMAAFAIVAIHSPFHNRPRTFLVCAAATATIAAWGSGSEGVLSLMADQAHEQMRTIVRDHFQDKALAAFLILFPTLWFVVKLPILGPIISAASSVGIAGLFGIKLWGFQKRHFEHIRHREQAQAALSPQAGLIGGLRRLSAQLNEVGISSLRQRIGLYAPLVVRLGKLALFGSFLLIYPMTTNSHISAVIALLAATLSSSSGLYRTCFSERNVDVVCLLAIGASAVLSIFWVPGFITGYTVGKYIQTPLHVDLDQICGVVDRVMTINKTIAWVAGVASGNSLWAVQEELLALRDQNEVGSPLDPLRQWLERFQWNNGFDRLRNRLDPLLPTGRRA